jgi:beta-N-acetylhexosaminidase
MMVVGEHTTLAQRKRKAMSRLILGFHGLMPSQELRSLLLEESPAGFILFRRNVNALDQVALCNQELRSLVRQDAPPLLSVDQEGGRVRRVRQTNWPPMRWLGNIDDISLTKKVIKGINIELQSLGFNANWAPCADVDSNPDNPIIGDRSFGRSADLCSKHVKASIEQMHSMGMIACAKHFPGHGDTNLDSHLDLPTVEKDIPELENCELVPFRQAIQTGVQIIMTAHVVFPAYDEVNPATMSRAIIQGILREKLQYNNLIVSDDMEMKAVRGRYPLKEQLDRSCKAGVDLFLVCSESELQQECFETLVHLQEESSLHEKLADESLKRLTKLRKKFFKERPIPSLTSVGCLEHVDLCELVRSRGEDC